MGNVMRTLNRIAFAVVLAGTLSTGLAGAQAWRGQGRVAGKVTDEAGKPVEGVTVKATLPAAEGGTEVRTNNKGDWAVGGIAGGAWSIDFMKEGYEPRRISVSISEYSRIPPVEIVLKKAATVVDPNVEIREQLVEAAGLMNRKQYAGARAIYEALLEKHPEAHQLYPLVARTYYGENQHDKSIETLRIALEKDPGNVEVKLLLGNILVEKGNAEEGKKILDSIDEGQVKDPATFLNVGIALMNQGKAAEALPFFAKAVTRFPADPDGYYYRGITYLQLGKTAEARTDLKKYLSIAPADAPERPTAEKILEEIGRGGQRLV
jgi:tetratricopeptide (TPR) repeat protein